MKKLVLVFLVFVLFLKLRLEIRAEKSFMINKIIFLTGSRTKLAHLRYLAKELPISIEGFHEASYHANYEEPRIFNREQL